MVGLPQPPTQQGGKKNFGGKGEGVVKKRARKEMGKSGSGVETAEWREL
jgi:hypothetical protein